MAGAKPFDVHALGELSSKHYGSVEMQPSLPSKCS